MKTRDLLKKFQSKLTSDLIKYRAIIGRYYDIEDDLLSELCEKYGVNPEILVGHFDIEYEEIPASEYNFGATRDAVKDIDTKTRQLRHKLHLANATVQVPEFGITIGECIILMAQLGKEKALLARMARREKKERRQPGFGSTVEWAVLNYDKDECRTKLKEVGDEITSLQMAIDRINLTHMVEVEIFE